MHKSTPVVQWGKHFASKIDLSNVDYVLDIGCRRGEMSTYLADLYPNQHFMGIDNDFAAIEQAQPATKGNLTFDVKDMLSLESPNYFDAIVSFSCLHWIPDKAKALKAIYQALKPGGKVYLQFFAKHGRLKNDRFLYQVARAPRWQSYFTRFAQLYHETTPGQFAHLVQDAGFLLHKMEIVRYDTPFDHPDQLQSWLGTWASHKHYLPAQKQESFLHETVQSYLGAHGLSHHDPFPYDEYVLEVCCEKPIMTNEREKPLLTPKEISVLRPYLQGKTAKEIAKDLYISPKTVEFHLINIKGKLNCATRSDVFQAALGLGI